MTVYSECRKKYKTLRTITIDISDDRIGEPIVWVVKQDGDDMTATHPGDREAAFLKHKWYDTAHVLEKEQALTDLAAWLAEEQVRIHCMDSVLRPDG